jgi:4-hydroxythreonine-4-phosphate dehydrogenase
MKPAPQVLLITMGDPAGIGPEIIVKAFQRGELPDAVVVGDLHCFRRVGAVMTARIDEVADLACAQRCCGRTLH